jgi:hypothetical protein
MNARLRVLVVVLAGCLLLWGSLLALERHVDVPNPQQYDEIEEGLLLGPRVSQLPPGAGAVLNLCESEDEYQAPVHRWKPIRDSAPAPSLDWLKDQVDFVAEQRARGVTTYVHCMNGVSRSGMVVTAYLMRERHWSRDVALEFVRSKRPDVKPNPAFMKLLLEWEKSLQP